MKMSVVRRKNFKIALDDILKDNVSIGQWNAVVEYREKLEKISADLLHQTNKRNIDEYKIKKIADELYELVSIWIE